MQRVHEANQISSFIVIDDSGRFVGNPETDPLPKAGIGTVRVYEYIGAAGGI